MFSQDSSKSRWVQLSASVSVSDWSATVVHVVRLRPVVTHLLFLSQPSPTCSDGICTWKLRQVWLIPRCGMQVAAKEKTREQGRDVKSRESRTHFQSEDRTQETSNQRRVYETVCVMENRNLKWVMKQEQKHNKSLTMIIKILLIKTFILSPHTRIWNECLFVFSNAANCCVINFSTRSIFKFVIK